jgi:putative ABC transport system ATP-binding protein
MKQITLDHLIPHTIKDRISPDSQIWNKALSFENNTFYAIKAISGSGKSTFINSVYGIRQDYEGTVSYDGVSISKSSNDELSEYRKYKISIVFQDLRLFGQLTALENILLKSTSDSLSQDQTAWVKRLKIESLLDRKSALLSFGERQRVAIVRALSQDFNFLLLDEPFSHLDVENGQAAYQLILEVAREKEAGIILTSLGNESYLEADQTLLL